MTTLLDLPRDIHYVIISDFQPNDLFNYMLLCKSTAGLISGNMEVIINTFGNSSRILNSLLKRAVEQGNQSAVKTLIDWIDPAMWDYPILEYCFMVATRTNTSILEELLQEHIEADTSSAVDWSLKYNVDVAGMIISRGMYSGGYDNLIANIFKCSKPIEMLEAFMSTDPDILTEERKMIKDLLPIRDVTRDHVYILQYLESYDSESFIQVLLRDNITDKTLIAEYSAYPQGVYEYAVDHNHIDTVKYILASGEANCGYDFTVAAENGYTDMFQLLLKYPIDNYSMEKAMVRAVNNGHAEIVRILLSEPNTNYKNTVFFEACRHGYVDIVRILLTDNRMLISGSDMTIALIGSMENNHDDVTQLLLSDSRCDPCADNTVIQLACKNGNLELVKLLLANPNVDPTDKQNACIIEASSKGHIDIVRLLLTSHQVDPSDQNNLALSQASKYGYTDIVELLLSDKRVNIGDSDYMILVNACRWGMLDIAKLLIDKINPSINSNAAIRSAAVNGHINIVKLLLDYPCVSTKEIINDTLSYAIVGNHYQIAELLVTHPSFYLQYNDYSHFQLALSHSSKIFQMLLAIDNIRITFNNNWCAKVSMEMKKYDVFRLVINHFSFDPSIDNYSVVKCLAKSDTQYRLEFMTTILHNPYMDPNFDDSWLLRHFIDTGDKNMIKLLLSHDYIITDPFREQLTALGF